jgi:hypothetical protein
MKPKEKVSKKEFENDYQEILKDLKGRNGPLIRPPQWTNPGDYIIKFSLFQESPYSITSTDTSVNL